MSKGRRSTPPRLRGNYHDAATPLLSRAVGSWAAGVSNFSINVRLSVQHKCHLLIRDGIRCQRCRSSPGPPRRRAFSTDVSPHRVSVDAHLAAVPGHCVGIRDALGIPAEHGPEPLIRCGITFGVRSAAPSSPGNPCPSNTWPPRRGLPLGVTGRHPGAFPPTGLPQSRHLQAGGSEVLSRANVTERNVDAVGKKRGVHTLSDMAP